MPVLTGGALPHPPLARRQLDGSGVDGRVQYFSLLRKARVYSAGNDPNPADICPTGRGALTQLCHSISTVKSIKSTHWESASHASPPQLSVFLFLYVSFSFRGDETRVWSASKEQKFDTSKIAWWGHPVKKKRKKKKKESWVGKCSVCLSCAV